MSRNLTSENQFLGFIVIKGKRKRVCIPPGRYEVTKRYTTYIILSLVARWDTPETNNYVSDVKVLKSRLRVSNDNYIVIKGFIEWNTNEVNNIVFESDYFKYKESLYIDSREYFNCQMAEFLGLERVVLESELLVTNNYSWDDKVTGNTEYDGVYGCKYNGEAPPFDIQMNWLVLVIEKIRTTESYTKESVKIKCKPEFISSGSDLILRLNDKSNRFYEVEFGCFIISYYKLCCMFMNLISNT